MKQVLLDNTLYVLRKEPYVINQDVENASVILVNCNTIEGFKLLNPTLDLTAFNYLVIRKWTAPYYQYVDQLDDAPFYFDVGIQNVSSYVDLSYTGLRQTPVTPDDLDVSLVYYFNDVLMDSSAFTLTEPGQYKISAEIKDSSKYLDELQTYIINYEKVKRDCTLSFATASYEVSTYKDENYTGSIQQVSGIPQGETVNYYIGNSLLSGNSITLTEPGFYVVSARLEDSSIYNDTSTSYTISYQKQKRTASLSFANATVDVSTWIDENYSGTIQAVQNAPANVTIHYYLDNVELQGNSITLSTAGQHIIKAAIVSDEVYNDTFTTYTINYVKNKRTAVLSFANSVVEETVEDVTEYTGQVQTVSGLPTGVTANYYLGNTLLNNGVISIDNLEEGENSFEIYAKIENDDIYNNATASYTLNITMEISSYENKYLTFESLEDGNTFKFTKAGLSYSTDKGNTWTELPANTSTSEIDNGEKIMFKGSGISATSSVGIGTFSSSGNFNAEGNIMSLHFGDNFNNQYSLVGKNYAFSKLFYNVNKISNVANLILPATTLSKECYSQLFVGCYFTTAPKLPATTLAEKCYSSMFFSCVFLTTAPELPATTLKTQCYVNMFQNCTSLTTAPELPATTFADYCYASMFKGCTSLTTSPELPATTLASNCYHTMFSGCSSLNYIKAACPPNSETNKTEWVKNVAATGTYIISDPNYNLNDGVIMSVNSIPPGWTIKDYQGNVINPKQIIKLSFTNSTVDVSTYSDENYYGTIQTANGIPSGVSANYYLNSSLLANKNITLTTAGTYTIKAAIENDANYNDTSTSYTLNYTKVKRDVTQLSVSFTRNSSIVDNEVFTQNETVARPQIDYLVTPANALVGLTYSTDGTNYSSSIDNHLNTSTIGDHYIYAKATVNSMSYNTSTAIGTYHYTVQAPAKQNLNLRFTDESDSPIRNLYIIEDERNVSFSEQRYFIGAYQLDAFAPAYGPDIYLDLPADLDVSVNWYIDVSYGNNVVPIDYIGGGQYAMQPGYFSDSQYDEGLGDNVEYNYDFYIDWATAEAALETELSEGDILDFIVRAKVENSSIYNDTSIFYIIRLTKVADAVEDYVCPECGEQNYIDNGDDTLTCNNCGHTWNPYEESEEEPEGGE